MNNQDLIRLAAEKVMGWTRIPDFPKGSRLPRAYSWQLENTPVPFCLWDDDQGLIAFREPHNGVVWNPLSCDVDCFALVDALSSEFMFRLGSHPWVARFFSPSGDEFDAVAEDRRRCIVIAALRAKGITNAR